MVHTSVHGVGHIFVQAAFKAFDLHPPYAVEEQKDPDPEFPTVKYPNPEEGEGVLVQYTDDIRKSFLFLVLLCNARWTVIYVCVCRRCPSRLQIKREQLLFWQMILMLTD